MKSWLGASEKSTLSGFGRRLAEFIEFREFTEFTGFKVREFRNS